MDGNSVEPLAREAARLSPRPATLVEMLRRRAELAAGQRAFLFLAQGEGDAEVLSYGELDTAARAIAGRLSGFNVAGKPVLLCLPPGLDYVRAFFGCLYAGAIAVPAYPPEPGRHRRTLPRLRAILHDAGAPVVITDRASLAEVEALGEEQGAATRARLVAIDALAQHPAAAWKPPPLDAGDLAFLMYTSGSTKTPRGVMMKHSSAIENLAGFPGFQQRPCRAFVNWLPFFHDLGLMFAILHPIFQGVPSVLMPPLAFVMRPSRWLEAIARYRATTTGGPDFAYQLCARKCRPEELATLDLSCLSMALNGAEPVRASTIDVFAETFAPCGFRREAFYPSYGLSDAAATVTGGRRLEPPCVVAADRRALGRGEYLQVPRSDAHATTLVGCGQALAGHRIVIVDPDRGVECQAGKLGEIWVSGPSNGSGYWNRPDEGRGTFRARLEHGGSDRFLRTGDLGFVRDGEVFVVGRLDDMMIIRGSNYHPEDLEPTVAACDPSLRLGSGAVFTASVDGEERLVVVQETAERDPRTLREIGAKIRAAVADCHEVEVGHLALIRPRTLPKTSSGKVRRRACREHFLAAGLDVVFSWKIAGEDAPEAPPDIRGWMIDRLARRLQVEPDQIDLDTTFAQHGLASVEVVSLVGEMARRCGRRLAPAAAWNFATIDALVRDLEGPEEAPENGPPERRLSPAGGDDAIAVVGLSCRFPGAPSVDALWALLAHGRDGITEVPEERWDIDAFYDPDPAAPGKMVSRWGGFVPDPDRLDAEFFGISPREAAHVDPRQRLLLELAWEALEDGGLPADDLAGSRTGVFIANLSNDFSEMLFRDLRRIDAYSGPGTANSILANRLSFHFDFRGPSMALDTACSGSLVAVHLACQSLRWGESELALAGGVSINLLPNGNVFFSKTGALTSDRKCKAFDSMADGIVRSDGGGVMVLKRLNDAVADQDRIYAVIRGSAVGQDGRSQGLMAPNGKAQVAVLEEAYRNAGVAPWRVQYVEAHGTGTSVGDPIEVEALGAVLGQGRPPGNRCALGSIKTNLGHMEAAAGVAGLTKVALAMVHRQIPPSLHFREANPLIAFDELPFVVQQELGAWPQEQDSLLAGVSSFGFGGTNAHIVVEQAPAEEEQEPDRPAPYLLVFSARGDDALRERVEAYSQLFSEEPRERLQDLVYTAAVRRSHHERRLACVGGDPDQLAAALDAFLDGRSPPGLAASTARRDLRPVVFVFSGQGSHYPGMGLELARQEPVFRQTMETCDRLFQRHVDWSLIEELGRPGEDSRLDDTRIMQPAVFAVQVALAELWRSWGIEPGAVVGQSLGEIAAAQVAGALDLEAAIRVVYHRSRLMHRAEGQGKTAVVGLPLREAELAVLGVTPRVVVAGSSSPETTVIAGEPEAVRDLLAALEDREVFCRLVPGVEVAFHSPQMDPLLEELADSLRGIDPKPTRIPLHSTVTGDQIAGEDLGSEYWGRNLRQPFLLSRALAGLIDDHHDTFLEISPEPVLGGALRQAFRHVGRDGLALGSLRRRDPREQLLASLGALYCQGWKIAWENLYPGGKCVALPLYPWQRQRHWYQDGETPATAPSSSPQVGEAAPADSHPLLGRHLALARPAGAHLWHLELSPYSPDYLDDHRVSMATVVPAAAYVEMALAAVAELHGDGPRAVNDVRFEAPLVLPPDGDRWLQISLSPTAGEEIKFEAFSMPEDKARQPSIRPPSGEPSISPPSGEPRFRRHASGRIVPLDLTEAPGEDVEPLSRLRARCTEELGAGEFYRSMAESGLQYGASFQPLRRLWRGDNQALGEVELRAAQVADVGDYQIHPALLDACLQLVAAAREHQDDEVLRVPIGVRSIELYRPPGERVWCHCSLLEAGNASGGSHIADLSLFSDDGEPRARVLGLRIAPIEVDRSAGGEGWIYQLDWRPKARPAAEVPPGEAQPDEVPPDEVPPDSGKWVVVADRGGVGAQLQRLIEESGESVELIESRPEVAAPGIGDLEERLREAMGSPIRGLIYLWGLDGGSSSECLRPDEEALGRGGLAVPALVRALGKVNQRQMLANVGRRQQPGPSAKLWLVTRGAMVPPLPGETPDLASAPLWGLGRVVALERRELWGGLVDLDPGCSTTAAAEALLEELRSPDGEDQIAFRGEQRLVCRLVRDTGGADSPPAPNLASDASYLITGGLGGLGLAVARRLIERGARRLILLGRTSLPPRESWLEIEDDATAQRIAAVLELERLGASVHLGAVDVADFAQLEGFVERFRRQGWPPIRGVVHAAGVFRDRLLQDTDQEAMESVLRPKISGAWALHRLFEADPIDFFVLFSSVASVMPTLGQGAYAGANAFLDALAHFRRSRALPALSINWGPWAEVGVAARSGLAAQHSELGMHALPVSGGLDSFEELLAGDEPQRLVMSVDWQQVLRAATSLPPLLETIEERLAHGTGPAAPDADAGKLLAELRQAEPEACLGLIVGHLQSVVGAVLRADPASFDPERPLADLAIDSIMTAEIAQRLEGTLGIRVPMVDLIVGPSLNQLASQIRAQIAGDGDEAPAQDRAGDEEPAGTEPG